MKKKGYDSKQNIKRKSMHKNIKNNLKFFTIFEKGTVMRTTFASMKIIQYVLINTVGGRESIIIRKRIPWEIQNS